MKARKKRSALPGDRKSETICWHCRRATGWCEWSAFGRPVPGWQAEQRWQSEQTGERTKRVLWARVDGCPKFWDDGQ